MSSLVLGTGRGHTSDPYHSLPRPPSPPLPPDPCHSHSIHAVGGTQHPLFIHQGAPTHVCAIHLHRCHVGTSVGCGLLATQNPASGLRC